MNPLALAMLALAVLAGCGDGETTTDTAAATDTATTSAATTSTATNKTTSTTTSAAATSDDDGAASPIVAAAVVLTSDGTPKQACNDFVTESFIQTAYGGIANCIAAREHEALARSISVGPGDVEGDPVQFVVIPKGGPYDGVRVEVEVIADGGSFRVDSLQAHVPAGP